ncbi:hypothetical protein L198_07734 [Cryptococcus wingfieldii CBS 7118]|uniref:Uncharacterized protein n=1 Tax=Cryptococcus wingfieldii CBS 7118 TaxID=1295528 RepID=A0A1E3I142_9TREE|nr:hypothetical protein L198_07734 [Cryptococcus wingfieldii CBS 7118]ODN82314.1 hypothetical protein L198_07734 [Cryptococcus wingfieldii CBS 7118]
MSLSLAPAYPHKQARCYRRTCANAADLQGPTDNSENYSPKINYPNEVVFLRPLNPTLRTAHSRPYWAYTNNEACTSAYWYVVYRDYVDSLPPSVTAQIASPSTSTLHNSSLSLLTIPTASHIFLAPPRTRNVSAQYLTTRPRPIKPNPQLCPLTCPSLVVGLAVLLVNIVPVPLLALCKVRAVGAEHHRLPSLAALDCALTFVLLHLIIVLLPTISQHTVVRGFVPPLALGAGVKPEDIAVAVFAGLSEKKRWMRVFI